MSKITEYIEDFWFLIFPYVCESCGVALGKNEPPVCFKCLYELPRTDYCVNQENPIVDLFVGRIKLEKATALFHYYKGSRFKKLLYGLKYKNKPQIGI